MANKLFKVLHPIFFWASMTAVILVSFVCVSLNYKIIIMNSVAAAESTYTPISRTILSETSTSRNYIGCDCEKRFNKEYPVVWSGRIIATFVSGEDFGVQRLDENVEYRQFYVSAQNKYTGKPGADVRVSGRLIGITCAYANTVFGECVGEVVADDVEVINTEIKKD